MASSHRGIVAALALAALAPHARATAQERPTPEQLVATLLAEVAQHAPEATPGGRVLRGTVVEGRPRFASFILPAGRCAAAAIATETIGPSHVAYSLLFGRRTVYSGVPMMAALGPGRHRPYCSERRVRLRLRVEMSYSGRGRIGWTPPASARFAAVMFLVAAPEAAAP